MIAFFVGCILFVALIWLAVKAWPVIWKPVAWIGGGLAVAFVCLVLVGHGLDNMAAREAAAQVAAREAAMPDDVIAFLKRTGAKSPTGRY